MQDLTYHWTHDGAAHTLRLAPVPGTGEAPYAFGSGDATRQITVPTFYIATTPTTQALWLHVMGHNQARFQGEGEQFLQGHKPVPFPGEGWPQRPMENVTWDDITGAGGFLAHINSGPLGAALAGQQGAPAALRLPTETEWEYAARGGPHWRDGYDFSGSTDIDAVAWFLDNSGCYTHPVAGKAPNQLGLYDMCGNVWEWCHDTFTRDVNAIPQDGSAYTGPPLDPDTRGEPDDARILRGGCHHNWKIHCTVHKRYEIVRDAHDECIGFRLACSI